MGGGKESNASTGGDGVIDRELIRQAEALNFQEVGRIDMHYRIGSDDPEIWIEYLGASREGPREFVLGWHGRRIGFSGPNRLAEINLIADAADQSHVYQNTTAAMAPSRTYVIDRIGDPRRAWQNGQLVTVVPIYKFRDRNEQAIAIALILVGLSQFFQMSSLPKNWPRTSRVVIAPHLAQELESGAPINEC